MKWRETDSDALLNHITRIRLELNLELIPFTGVDRRHPLDPFRVYFLLLRAIRKVRVIYVHRRLIDRHIPAGLYAFDHKLERVFRE